MWNCITLLSMIFTYRFVAIFFIGMSVLVLSGCGKNPQCSAHKHPAIQQAVSVIEPTAGHAARGTVYFKQVEDGVQVQVNVEGLNPNQQHGAHIHEFGDRTAPNGTSAGGHYNPEGHPHALPPNLKRHAGSFGNWQADAYGRVQVEFVDQTISVSGRKNPIVGRSVVIHAQPDDGSQPNGNAGPRIGVGVIGIQKQSQ